VHRPPGTLTPQLEAFTYLVEGRGERPAGFDKITPEQLWASATRPRSAKRKGLDTGRTCLLADVAAWTCLDTIPSVGVARLCHAPAQ
jgi:hypothetical protein